jgi:hypothetical protein
VAVALLALVGGGYFAMRAGVALVQREIEVALGPGSSVGSIRADWNDVELTDLRIAGGDGWPAADAVRAARVRIVPRWWSLLADRIEIARVELSGAYLSALRTRDAGLRVLPTLAAAPPPGTPSNAADPAAPTPAQAARVIAIGEVQLQDGDLEIFDATVATPPWKIHLREIDATLRDVVAPAFATKLPIDVSALLVGPKRNGRVAFSGWLDPATRDLELGGSLRGVDLLALQPYFVEKAKGRLASGELDLDIRAVVAARRLRAPGRLTLSHIAFDPRASGTARVFGVPRDLLLAGLAARGGVISLDFSLDGDIDDPKFSLNEMLATRIAVQVASQLGLSVGGLVEGVGGLGIDGLEGAGKAAGGIGSALRKLIPKRK